MHQNAFKYNYWQCWHCPNQEPEGRKSQCVDQKPVTASLTCHRKLITASLSLCKHQILRDQVSRSKNVLVSAWVIWGVSVRLQNRMLWVREAEVTPAWTLLLVSSNSDVMADPWGGPVAGWCLWPSQHPYLQQTCAAPARLGIIIRKDLKEGAGSSKQWEGEYVLH